jgi:putative ABC transport system permease protein
VALGLGLVAAVFTVLNALVFRVDAVPDVHEIFAVERPQAAGEPARFTRDKFDALRRETNFFSGVYAQVDEVDSRWEGRLTDGTFVTGNFFQVLRVSAAMGRVLTPADDAPFAEQPVMVLSHRGWDRLFARDPTVVGRRLLVRSDSG